MSRRARALMFVSIVVLCGVIGGCGNDTATSSSPATTTASPEDTSAAQNAELCAQRDALESSLQELRSVNVVTSGTAGIETALTKVRTNVQTLRETARGEYRDQTQALDDALQELDAAVKNVDAGGVTAVVTAAGKVVTSGNALLESLRTLDCN
jgi:4-hydroxy-L-threonine phosphate dehydrogenase PdxA